MTSKNWKEKRERETFRQDLEDYWRKEHLKDHFQTTEEWLLEQYAEDCRNGLFDDRGIADWDDPYEEDWYAEDPDWEELGLYYEDPYWDETSKHSYDRHVDPGNHVKCLVTGKVYLVLEDYRWADLFTGRVTGPRRYIDSVYYEKIF